MIVTLGRFNIDDVLPFIYNGRKTYTALGNKYNVNMNSLRYHTFKKSLSCVCCDLTGTHFLLQFSGSKQAWEQNDNTAHFNLFSDSSVLMTRDHIRPRSKGGKDYIDNLQTMCIDCNVLKDSKEISIEQLRKLRDARKLL